MRISRVNALPATRATHRTLIRPRLWPYSFAKCHARVGKIERTTGCRVVFALPFFFFFYRLLQLHNLLLLFCGFALETFQKTRVIFFLGKLVVFSLSPIFFYRALPILTTSSDHNKSFVSFVPFEYGAHARFVRRAPISKSIVIEKITVPNDTRNRNRRLFSVYKSYETPSRSR